MHVGAGSPKLIVYFDNFSGASNVQRGLVLCSRFGCRKHINVFGTREEFCAQMYCWQTDGVHVHLDPEKRHTEHIPAPADVQAVLAGIVLEDF